MFIFTLQLLVHIITSVVLNGRHSHDVTLRSIWDRFTFFYNATHFYASRHVSTHTPFVRTHNSVTQTRTGIPVGLYVKLITRLGITMTVCLYR